MGGTAWAGVIKGPIAGEILQALVRAGIDLSCKTQRCAALVRELSCVQSADRQICQMKVQGRTGMFEPKSISHDLALHLFDALVAASAPLVCDAKTCELLLHEVSCFGDRSDVNAAFNQCTLR